MDEKYEWRFCTECHMRIFKDEVEDDTIKTIDGEIYCIDCALDLLMQENKSLREVLEFYANEDNHECQCVGYDSDNKYLYTKSIIGEDYGENARAVLHNR